MLNSSPSPSKDAHVNPHSHRNMDDALDAALNSAIHPTLEPTIDPQLQEDVESLLSTVCFPHNNNNNNNNNNNTPGPKHLRNLSNHNFSPANNNFTNNSNNNNKIPYLPIHNLNLNRNSIDNFKFSMESPNFDSFITFTPNIMKKSGGMVNDPVFSFSPSLGIGLNGLNTPNNKSYHVEDLFDTPYINSLYSNFANTTMNNINMNSKTYDTPINKIFEKQFQNMKNNSISSSLKNVRDLEEKSVSPCDNHKKMILDDELMKNLDIKTMTSTPSGKNKGTERGGEEGNSNELIESSPSTIIINSVTKSNPVVNLIECSPTPDNKEDIRHHSKNKLPVNELSQMVIPVMGIFKENDAKEKVGTGKKGKDNSIHKFQHSFNDKENKGKRKHHGSDKIHFIMADPDQLRGNKRRKKILKNNTNIVNNRGKKSNESNIFLDNK